VGAERTEDGARVAAASERAVDVDAVVTDCEAGDRLVEQDGNVRSRAGRGHGEALKD
jgi:hypothetical protein